MTDRTRERADRERDRERELEEREKAAGGRIEREQYKVKEWGTEREG